MKIMHAKSVILCIFSIFALCISCSKKPESSIVFEDNGDRIATTINMANARVGKYASFVPLMLEGNACEHVDEINMAISAFKKTYPGLKIKAYQLEYETKSVGFMIIQSSAELQGIWIFY